MTLKQRLQRKKDDTGAALVIALLFITVVAVTVAGVLAYADANVRATEALRDQASIAATADAAAEVAINAMRQLPVDPDRTTCFASGNTFDPGALHEASSGGGSDSAFVECETDSTTSESFTTGIPSGYALLALQNNSALEDAIYVQANGPATGINVAGDVGSASNIRMFNGDMHVAGSVTAKACAGTIIATGTKNCGPGAPSLTDPNYTTPPAPTAAGSVSACAAKITFTPGVYSDLGALNDAWSRCSAAQVFDFRPGIYYFSFSGLWTINKGTTIGGSGSPLGTTPPSIPGACPNPMETNTPHGVTFVFGNDAQLRIRETARVEICGRRPVASTEPAIAFYGLKSPLGSGSLLVPAQTGCVTRTTGGAGSRCAAITTDNRSDNVRFYFQGHVYMPRAKVDLDLRQSSDQYLNGGVTVRAFSMFSPASAIIPTPLSSGPVREPEAGRTVVLLTIYVCPEQLSCTPAANRIRLRVKVGFKDDPGAALGDRGVTIYNWSVQR